jgi:hypothetical protein
MGARATVACYYFPNYHPDPRNAAWHGAGWTEWELVRHALPRFPGHRQPRVPLWGYEDESDPAVMARKIDVAADHGIDVFLFDWYWYQDGPYLERALERGFLGAAGGSRLRFALMWANHDWMDIHPAPRARPHRLLAAGRVSPEGFVRATDHVIRTCFAHPDYWRLDGALYFSIYELSKLIEGFGGIEETRRGLEDLRSRVRAAGLGELHLNAVVWGRPVLPGEKPIDDVDAVVCSLGFDSTTSYVWIHHQRLATFPQASYAEVRDRSIADWSRFARERTLPYFPNVTMGWDASPRTIASDLHENLGYPHMSALDGNTPLAFRRALEEALAYLERSALRTRVLTLNAWNEWTEGSYLEPDTENGYAYLEAVRAVFGACR